MTNTRREAAKASELGVELRSVNDISDVLIAAGEGGGLILTEEDICPEFFDLRSGLAGEVLQKFVTYHARVAIVVPTPNPYGDRFNELMYEHRAHPFVRFPRSIEEANAWLVDAS